MIMPDSVIKESAMTTPASAVEKKQENARPPLPPITHFYTCPPPTLRNYLMDAPIHFFTLFYAFTCFYMLSFAFPFQHCHIHFSTLLYAITIHAFIHFWYAFIRIQTQKSKTSPPPRPPPTPS